MLESVRGGGTRVAGECVWWGGDKSSWKVLGGKGSWGVCEERDKSSWGVGGGGGGKDKCSSYILGDKCKY